MTMPPNSLVILPDRITPRLISLLLREAGWTQARIAAELGLRVSSISYGMQTGSSTRLRTWVSGYLGIPEAVIWPTRALNRPPAISPAVEPATGIRGLPMTD